MLIKRLIFFLLLIKIVNLQTKLVNGAVAKSRPRNNSLGSAANLQRVRGTERFGIRLPRAPSKPIRRAMQHLGAGRNRGRPGERPGERLYPGRNGRREASRKNPPTPRYG